MANSLLGVSEPTLDDGDLATQIISNLFGEDWATVSGSGTPTGNAEILYTMLEQLNELCVFAVFLLLSMTTLTALVNSSRDGVALGKTMDTFWVPIRACLSAGLLVPIKYGMCTFQVVLLLAVGYSIHYSNLLWDAFVDVAVDVPPNEYIMLYNEDEHPNRIIAADLVNNLSQNLLHVYSADFRGKNTSKEKKPSSDQYYAGYWLTTNMVTDSSKVSSYRYAFINPDEYTTYVHADMYVMTNTASPTVMGGISIECGSTDEEQATCTNLLNQITYTIEEVKKLAYAYMGSVLEVNGAYLYTQDEYLEDLNAEIDLLSLAFTAFHQEEIDALYEKAVSDTETFKKSIKEFGFIAAGSFYHSVAAIQRKSAGLVSINVSSTPIYLGSGDNSYKANRANTAIKSSDEITKSNYNSYLEKIKTDGVSGLLSNTTIIGNKAISMLSQYDPMYVVSYYGNNIIGSINTAMITWIGINALVGGADGLSSSVLGLVGFGAVSGVAAGLIKGASAFLNIFIVPLYVAGHMLAYYVPAVPFIIWTAAVISWIILVVEVIVAAPIWIVSHAMPEGEGFVGNNARRGYMLLLGILLRPFLMVMGLCIAMTITQSIGFLVGFLFNIYTGTLGDVTDTSTFVEVITTPNEMLAMTILITALMVVLTHRTFSLIHYLPDKIMRWIGGESGDYGATERDECKINAIVSSGTNSMRALNMMSLAGGNNPKATNSSGGGSGSDDDKEGSKNQNTVFTPTDKQVSPTGNNGSNENSGSGNVREFQAH